MGTMGRHSRRTMYMVWAMLGSLGVHRMICGRFVSGVAQATLFFFSVAMLAPYVSGIDTSNLMEIAVISAERVEESPARFLASALSMAILFLWNVIDFFLIRGWTSDEPHDGDAGIP